MKDWLPYSKTGQFKEVINMFYGFIFSLIAWQIIMLIKLLPIILTGIVLIYLICLVTKE